MTLGIGNRVAKLAQVYDPEKRESSWPEPSQLVKGEAYHEFEVLEIEGSQGSPEGFVVKLKVVR